MVKKHNEKFSKQFLLDFNRNIRPTLEHKFKPEKFKLFGRTPPILSPIKANLTGKLDPHCHSCGPDTQLTSIAITTG